MSNFRWSFGIGPIRYNAPIGGKRKSSTEEQKKPGCLGSVITLIVTFGLIYLCCWGGLAWTASQQP